MMNEKIQAILEDPTFAAEIEHVATMEGMQAAFKARGAELSLEEVEAICVAAANSGKDELDENDLEGVAGGVAPWLVAKAAACVVIGVTAAYIKYKSTKK